MRSRLTRRWAHGSQVSLAATQCGRANHKIPRPRRAARLLAWYRMPRMPARDLIVDSFGPMEHRLTMSRRAGPGERVLNASEAISVLRTAVLSYGLSMSSLWSFVIGGGRGGFLPRTSSEQWAELGSLLRFGQLVVVERKRELARLRHDVAYEGASPPKRPARAPPPADIVEDRSLLITRCDSELATAGPLAFTYLLRGLAGQAVTLRIASDSFPGQIVHEQALAPAQTSDGSHNGTWDGIVTTAGDLQGQRLPALYSPARVELVHDDVYRDAAKFTISRRKIVIVDIGGFCFETDREVLLPDIIPLADEEPGPARVPAIDAAAAIYRFARAHPEKSLFVAGHTDTVGRHADNRVLSENRARNVQLYLRGDHGAWAEHCCDNYEVHDQQRVLAWIAHAFPEYDCDPRAIDGDMGPLTRAAQNVFRQHHAARTGSPMPAGDRLRVGDWQAFASLYDRAVRVALGEQLDLETARSQLAFAEPVFAGFGESFPSDRPDLDSLDSERNRRVEVIFLDKTELELASDPSGEALYGEHADILREHIPLGFIAGHDEIAFRFIDEFEQPIGDLQFDLETSDGRVSTCFTDTRGESRVGALPRGTCRVRLIGVDAIDWTSEVIDERTLPAPPKPKPNEYVEPDEEGDDGPIDETVFHLVFDDDPD
jgi:hypothetical protein